MTEQELETTEKILAENCLDYGNFDVCKEACECFELCEEWQAERLKRS